MCTRSRFARYWSFDIKFYFLNVSETESAISWLVILQLTRVVNYNYGVFPFNVIENPL